METTRPPLVHWSTQPAQRRCCQLVPRHLTVCTAVLFIVLVVTRHGTSITHWSSPSDSLSASKTVRHLTDKDVEELYLPISRLVEPALPSRAWFSGDPSCAYLLTWFGRPGSLPDARLVSYHRSGNTWTRYLLETATGFVTCGPKHDSEDNEPLPIVALPSVAEVAESQRSPTSSVELKNVGFIAEYVSPLTRTCIVGKTHAYPPTWRRLEGADNTNVTRRIREDFGGDSSDPFSTMSNNSSGYLLPAVLLIRDPFRAIISLRHYTAQSSIFLRQSRADAVAFDGPDWHRFVDTHSRYWVELAAAWAAGPRHTLLVAYERLVAEPAPELRRMLRFLGVTPAPERLRCTLRHVEGPFRNERHPVAPDEAVFDAATRRMVWHRIRLVNDLLVSRGYQQLPLEKYAFYGTA